MANNKKQINTFYVNDILRFKLINMLKININYL